MQRFNPYICPKRDNLIGNYDHEDDKALIRDCLHNQAAAQKALYERFSSSMMGVCYRYARNRADAEDMLQEGFIRVFTHLGQYRSEGSLEGWIRRIMVTTAINFLNRNKYLQQQIEIEQAGAIAAGGQADDSLHGRELLELMHRLPTGYKTVLNLYAVEGYSHKEIGQMLGIAESTSRSQYARAKELLSLWRKGQLSPRQEGNK
jgi:RNA polymerase sigma-70 factor (ECF subfamily)